MRKLKKTLSLALVLALSLSLAVPAMAAGGYQSIQDVNWFDCVVFTDATKEREVTITNDNQKVTLYSVSVGSAIGCTYDGTSLDVSKATKNADGRYTVDFSTKKSYNDGVFYDSYHGLEVSEAFAGSTWFVKVMGIWDDMTFLFEVEGSASTQPEQPTEPTTPVEPEQPTEPTTPVEPEQPALVSVIAAPTNDALTLDGKAQTPTVFKLDGGDNYFKIRDLAAMLSGTSKQFEVGYDGAVQVTTGKSYTPVGGELAGKAEGNFIADPTNDAIYINGVKTDITAYKIEGNNFFRLRDLGKALDFYVGWTPERGMFIETDKPYSE